MMTRPEFWQLSLPHSTSIWGAQLKSKDNSLFSPIASKQASINSVNKPRPQQTEKIQGTQQGHKMSCNVGARLFSGFLVSSASGVVEWNCLMKQQSNTQKKGHLWLFECFAWITEPNSTQQVRYVGIKRRILFGMFKKL